MNLRTLFLVAHMLPRARQGCVNSPVADVTTGRTNIWFEGRDEKSNPYPNALLPRARLGCTSSTVAGVAMLQTNDRLRIKVGSQTLFLMPCCRARARAA